MSKKISYVEQQRHTPLTELNLQPQPIKKQIKKREEKAFRVVFEYQGLHEESPTCDHCELNSAIWWCEHLVVGWCDECMVAQEKDINYLNKKSAKKWRTHGAT